MKEKNSFVLFTENQEIFEYLSDEEAGKLIKAIFRYVTSNEAPELEKNIMPAFIAMKQDIDRNNLKWENTKLKRSEAGKKGGAPKGNNNARKKTTENNQKQLKQTKQAKQTKQPIGCFEDNQENYVENEAQQIDYTNILKKAEKLVGKYQKNN